MKFRIDPSAQKALSLGKDAVFRLLVLMMILLGWLSAMGTSALLSLEEVYNQWQLSQKSHISVYLMPDTSPRQVQTLEEALIIIPGVKDMRVLSQSVVRDLVAPYLGYDTTLPMPKILDVQVDPRLDRDVFDARVKELFPLAEVDDARSMLQTVAESVRFVQAGAFIAATAVFTVLALLVALTVRSGLRAQQHALNILQYVGATNAFLKGLILRQVFVRAALGMFGAVLMSAATIAVLHVFYAPLVPYLTSKVWAAALGAPMLLMLVVMLAAYWSAGMTLTAKYDMNAPEKRAA